MTNAPELKVTPMMVACCCVVLGLAGLVVYVVFTTYLIFVIGAVALAWLIDPQGGGEYTPPASTHRYVYDERSRGLVVVDMSGFGDVRSPYTGQVYERTGYSTVRAKN